MNWDTDISESAKETMKFLGNFGPADIVGWREVKGRSFTLCEERAYLSADELRKIAAGCIEVADWLDKRAESK